MNNLDTNLKMEDALPKGWCVTEIENILKPQSDGKLIHQGWSPQCDKKPAAEDEWGVLKTTAIQDGFFLEHENKKLPLSKQPKPRVEVHAGDLLVTNAGPRSRCGVICFVKQTREKLLLSGKMYRLRFPDNYIHPSYIESWLRTSIAQKELNDRKTGISESGLNMTQAKFKTLPVIIAPIAEQRVIADTLDELLAQVNNTKVRLDAIPAILKSFRQSVLAKAVSGRLTEHNRIKDTDYTAKIQNEINSDKKLKKLQHLSSEEISLAKSMHGEINWDHWNLMPLELLVESERGIPYGIVQTGEHFEGGVPTVRCGDVKPLEILKQQLKLVDNNIEKKYKRTSLVGGEVLLAIRGTVGNAAVASRDMQGFNISREVAMIPLRPSVNPNFIALLLQSPTGYRCLAEKVRGVAQKGINLSDVKRFVTPLPSLEEQIEIVSRVEELFDFADKVEAQVNEAQTKVNNLTQSILAKAFRGELTADWRAANSDLVSGENSAEALLKGIKSEREDFIRAAKEKPVKKFSNKSVATKKPQNTVVDKNLTPVESVIADGVAHNPQDIFDKLTPDLSMTEVFNEISKLLSANKIEEKTVDGITGFFIK